MCGQAGIIRMGNKPINDEALTLFLTGNEHRGTDATGLAFLQEDGTVDVCKKDEIAWKFVGSDEYTQFILDKLQDSTWAVLLHTRAATQGSPRKSVNNHPITNGKSAIVHNGIIHNEQGLYHRFQMDKVAETDSDIIRAFVDKYGITEDCIEKMSAISGSAAGAAIHPEYPHRLLLFRSGSPMVLASNDDFFCWSSEKTTIHRAMRPWIERFNMVFKSHKTPLDFSPMPDDSAYIITPEGLGHRGKFKTLGTQYNEPHRRVYENYSMNQNRWNAEQARATQNLPPIVKGVNHWKKSKWDDAWCAACARRWEVPKGADPTKYYCNQENKVRPGCGGRLTEVPGVVVTEPN